MLITNLCLASASCAALRGLILIRREKYFQKMFQDIEKMQLFNISYLQSLQDLPINQHILLAGKATSNNLQPTFSDKSNQVILSQILPTIPEKTKDLGDGLIINIGRISSYEREQHLSFLLSGNGLSLHVKQIKKTKIFLFNLPKLRDNITKIELSGLKLNQINPFQQTFTEYAMIPDKEYVVCGRLESEGFFTPKMIFGSSKESFIDSLDSHLNQLHNSAKYWLISSCLIGIAASIYARFTKQSVKKNNKPQ